MGYCRTRKLDAKHFTKVAKESLRILRGLVVFVGKPLYLTLLCFVNLSDLIISIFYRIVITKPLRTFSFVLLLSSFSIFLISLFLSTLPSPQTLSNPPSLTTKIYDRNGVLLYNIYENENRSLIKLSDIPNYAINATLAVEDNEFYTHPGFSLKGIIRAIYKNIKDGKRIGGSTITQQLVKNTLLTPEKSLKRKIKELVLAIEVEIIYSKNEILEMYLNNSPYGGVVYGIREAAYLYFNKNVSDLTLSESAFLAGLPKSPTDYSPFTGNPTKSLLRQKEVLKLMSQNNYISKKEYENALKEDLIFFDHKDPIIAPHFVMYVKELLKNKFDESIINNKGLEITTSLDINIQKMSESIVKQEITKFKNYNVTNAGVLVINPSNGEILAMVGSENYFNRENDGNVNTIFSIRSPGSTIKPVNYAYALSHGYTLSSVINDSPVTYTLRGSSAYSPVNYDKTYKGNLTIREALAQSRNIPAVKILSSYGTDKMIDLGQTLGITTWNDKYGLSITLGGANTTLFDMAQVYSVFANFGIRKNLNPIKNILTSDGLTFQNSSCDNNNRLLIPTIDIGRVSNDKSHFHFQLPLIHTSYASNFINEPASNTSCEETSVLDPRIAYLITSVLSDNTARSPTFGRFSLLNITNHPEVAVKTGTSNSLRDNVTIGYTKDYLVAVWVGNNNNTPMSNVASGVTGATPIFNKIMSELLKDKESYQWQVPKGLVKKPVCIYFKNKEDQNTSIKKYDEWFLEDNLPKNICPKIF